MGRLLSVVWILTTIIVNVFALAALLRGFGLADTQWGQPLYGLGVIYHSLVAQGLEQAAPVFQRYLGFAPPWWTAHLFVVYAASASAIAASGMGVARRATLTEGAQSAGLSVIWPIAIFAFVLDAIRLRIVSRFAQDHAIALLIYVLAVAGGYAGARYVNAHHLEPAQARSNLAPADLANPTQTENGSKPAQ